LHAKFTMWSKSLCNQGRWFDTKPFLPNWGAGYRKMCKRFCYVFFIVVGSHVKWNNKTLKILWKFDHQRSPSIRLPNLIATCFVSCHHVIDFNYAKKIHIKSIAPMGIVRVRYKSLSIVRKFDFDRTHKLIAITLHW
jgi:hypothetical protein